VLIGYNIPVSTDIRVDWLKHPMTSPRGVLDGTNPRNASNVVELAAWSCSRRQSRPAPEDEGA
jgi:hypothetical protein